MPILCEPNKTFTVVLPGDKDKDPAPMFIAKSQSLRGQLDICETLDAYTNPELDVRDLFTKTIDKLTEVFVGWKNIPGEFSRDALVDLLNFSEARDLLRAVLYHSQLDHETKKD